MLNAALHVPRRLLQGPGPSERTQGKPLSLAVVQRIQVRACASCTSLNAHMPYLATSPAAFSQHLFSRDGLLGS